MDGTYNVAVTQHASQNLRKRSTLARYRQRVLLGQKSNWAEVGSVLQQSSHDEMSNGFEEDVQLVFRRKLHNHRWGSREATAIFRQIDEGDTRVTKHDPEHTRRDPSSFPKGFYDPEMVGNHDECKDPTWEGRDQDIEATKDTEQNELLLTGLSI
ncbi:hypothetical protein AAF712_012395 [Marasmius tenuissimus]|uniref:Uncharacterized protein n=1 Tax=Marasmius tenuissimus TaxID=585030 RepID=A0ABR2ZHS8_9AGAR